MLNELQVKNMDIDVKDQFQRFKDHLSANGKRYKDYQAAFRNWIKSPYVEKTDKIRLEVKRKREEAEARAERKRLQEMQDSGEIGGPPPEFTREVKKMLGKMRANK